MTNLPILGVTCDDLTDPVNGEVQFTTRFGDTATYTCTLGYMPDGASERTCEANGEWSGVAPACVRKFTSDPYCHLLDIDHLRERSNRFFTCITSLLPSYVYF